VPPDQNTAKCEDTVARHLNKLVGCATKCQIKQADSALRGLPFDEQACEQGGTPVSCRAAYDRATAALLRLQPTICPLCLNGTVQSNLADLMTSFVEDNNGQIYCAGMNSFGGDDGGFVPPDQNTARCEDTVAKHLKKLAGASRSARSNRLTLP